MQEAEAEAIQEVIETVSDNEVTIAAIEAEKEVAIAEIHAEARVEEAKAYSESNEEWKQDLTDLRLTVSTLQAELAAMQTPPLSLVSEAEIVEAIAEAEVMSDLIPQSTLTPESETLTEVIEESVEEKPVLAVEVSGKPIIRLV